MPKSEYNTRVLAGGVSFLLRDQYGSVVAAMYTATEEKNDGYREFMGSHGERILINMLNVVSIEEVVGGQ